MPARRPLHPHQRGLGWDHRRNRERLLARHRDGDLCPCLDLDDCGPSCPCRPHGRGLPMYRDAASNVDGMPLEADHTEARSQGGLKADRLLLAICNRSRGAGLRRADGTDYEVPEPDENGLRYPWWTRQWF